ncbi:MAG TPA: plasmid stabilization protein [Dehalococcoidia bacterium]|nr:plasmid stabilization protein [Chloroflexota bacterium]HCL26021.1 plasmid stabilization protein [Dehalococcoidia bacterium]|tara:strand:- start:199 stop:492 length:294 start_codon:yes stop_codon:yes gene_type:complete
MAEVRWTEEALRWVEDIYEYVRADEPAAAQRIVLGIFDRAQDVLSFPEIGYRYQPSARNVRILMYGHYRIAYLVKEEGDVDILGVFHSSLDISRYQL